MNMTPGSGAMVQVPQTPETFGDVRRPQNNSSDASNLDASFKTNENRFVEGPRFYKRNCKHYLKLRVWAKVVKAYSMSDSSIGLVHYKDKVRPGKPPMRYLPEPQ